VVNWYGNPTGGPLLASDTNAYTPAGAGTFYAVAFDPETGCYSNSRTPITLAVNENPSVWGGLNEFACQGIPVTFVAQAIGGDGDYVYSWTNGLSSTDTLTVTPVTHTSYTVSVTDGNGCHDFDVVTAVVYELPAIITEDGETICAGNCVMLSASASGGQSPYSFSWSGGSTLVCPDVTTAYSVTVSDDNGCSADEEITITVMDTLSPVFYLCPEDITSINCVEVIYDLPQAADNCGVEMLEQTEGLPSGATFPEGTTTITYRATDTSGNEEHCHFYITVQNTLEVQTTVSAYTCDPEEPYTAALTASGGTEGYIYLWGDGNTTAETILIAPAPWSWTVTDSQGCERTATIDLPIPNMISITLEATAATNMEQNGAIDATVTGGTGGYGYSWFDELGNLFGTGEDLTQIPAGTYCLQVTDENECIAQACVEVENITSTIDRTLESSISLLPNPASEQMKVVFDLPQQEEAELILLYMNGQEVRRISKQSSSSEVTMEMNTYAEGVYLLKIVVGNSLVVKKVVVSR
jgi:hypothetical protein